MKIALAGATGFIGRALVARLRGAGHALVMLTRRSGRFAGQDQMTEAVWDGRTPGDWVRGLRGVEAVINLAGEPLSQWPWTRQRKQRLLQSRVDATRVLVRALDQLPERPKVFVNASAVGYYGSGGEAELDERSAAGSGFLSGVCQAWEAEAMQAQSPQTRVAVVRLGLVLGPRGGALSRMAPVFRWFLGGPLGSGQQWLSWIHLEDAAAALAWVLEDLKVQGPVNLTAPEPVRMREFCRALGRALRRPSWLRIPGPLLRLGVGDMAELFSGGQRVKPAVLQRCGFHFSYPLLSEALADALGRESRQAQKAGRHA